MKKKLMSIGLTVFLMFGVVPTGYAGERISENPDVQVLENTDEKKVMQEVEFKDLDKSHWAYDSINAMNERGIIVGYDDNKFKPDNTVTYAEFIKMAVIADHEENVGVSSEGHWANNYYQEALDRGYFDRADISYIQLDDQISRSDMALILSNIIGDKEVANYESLDKALTDIKTTAKNEYHIKKVYTAGILSGYPDNTFKPEKTLSRAEAASVIYRLFDKTARVFPNIEEEEQTTELIAEVEEKETMYRVNYSSGRYIEVPYYEAKLGDYGIIDFEVLLGDELMVKSSVVYDAVPLVINHKFQAYAGNVDGTNYWVKNGKYVYDDYVENYTQECHPILLLNLNGTYSCVEFKDVTITKVSDGQYKTIKH